MENLYLLSEAELRNLSYSLDSFGRIVTGNGDYVCALSGRLHKHYLIPMPQLPDSIGGQVRIVWVDDDAFRAVGRGMGHVMKNSIGESASKFLVALFEAGIRKLIAVWKG